MLLVVGWSSVVVWLNVRPRVTEYTFRYFGAHSIDLAEYGCPWSHSSEGIEFFESSHPPVNSFGPDVYYDYPALAANLAIGLLAVAVLTFASKYLVRAIVAGLRRLLSKPPPDKGNGPSESN